MAKTPFETNYVPPSTERTKAPGERAVPPNMVRARDDDGTFRADDPSTPNVNEAYADGKTPTKKQLAKAEAADRKAAKAAA